MRVYTVSSQNVSVSAAQDIIALYSTSGGAFEVHEFVIGQITATTVGNLRLRVRRLPATVTAGSGGTTPTPSKSRSGDAAATITAHANDTTQATTNGTALDIRSDAYNPINGYQYLPAPEDRAAAGLSEAIVFSLDTAPGSAETSSATAVFAELVPV
jgi:hypothetical protein